MVGFEDFLALLLTEPAIANQLMGVDVLEALQFDAKGGYILAPAHAVQGGTPPENIVALLEEADRFYPDQPDTPIAFNTEI
jgi:hypothetical protein